MRERTREESSARSWRDNPALLLFRAAHPRLAVAVTVGLTVAAAATGRSEQELVLVALTVALGQTLLGWHNGLVDRELDARYDRDKPIAAGRLDPGTVSFSFAVVAMLVVPLALTNGVWAGAAYLLSLAVGLLGNYHAVRRGLLSWVPWVAAYALYAPFLSYGGWAWGGRQSVGSDTEPAMIVLAGMVGLGMHVLTGLWGLVADNNEGWRHLVVRLALKLSAGRLLGLTLGYLAAVLIAVAVVAAS